MNLEGGRFLAVELRGCVVLLLIMAHIKGWQSAVDARQCWRCFVFQPAEGWEKRQRPVINSWIHIEYVQVCASHVYMSVCMYGASMYVSQYVWTIEKGGKYKVFKCTVPRGSDRIKQHSRSYSIRFIRFYSGASVSRSYYCSDSARSSHFVGRKEVVGVVVLLRRSFTRVFC